MGLPVVAVAAGFVEGMVGTSDYFAFIVAA